MVSHMEEVSFFLGVCERTVERYISNLVVLTAVSVLRHTKN